MRHLTSCAIAALFLMLVGCGEEGGGGSQEPGDLPTYKLSDAPLASIGGSDERGEYILNQVVRALRLSDGSMVVADASALELRFFSGDGSFLRKAGGAGEGPGEFVMMTTVERLPGDTVAVWDRRAKRLSLFPQDADGAVAVFTFSRSFAFPGPARPFLLIPDYEAFPLSGGRIATIPMSEPMTQGLPAGPYSIQDTVSITLMDRNESGIVEVGSFPSQEWYFFNGSGRIFPGGFSERIRVAAGDTVVYAASTKDSAIRILSAEDGTHLGSISLPEPRAFSPEDREALRERMLQSDSGEAFEAMPLPAVVPTFSNMMSGADGRLWVELFHAAHEPVEEWLAFEASGAPSARLRMDAAFRLMDAGNDYAIVHATDDLGRESVHLYGLEPEAP